MKVYLVGSPGSEGNEIYLESEVEGDAPVYQEIEDPSEHLISFLGDVVAYSYYDQRRGVEFFDDMVREEIEKFLI